MRIKIIKRGTVGRLLYMIIGLTFVVLLIGSIYIYNEQLSSKTYSQRPNDVGISPDREVQGSRLVEDRGSLLAKTVSEDALVKTIPVEEDTETTETQKAEPTEDLKITERSTVSENGTADKSEKQANQAIDGISVVSPQATTWVTIMEEDGGSFPSENNWDAFDQNSDSGEDYWDDVSCRDLDSGRSIWSADIGTSDDCVLYDNDMDAWMIYGPFDLSDAVNANFGFYDWVQTEEDYDYFRWGASSDGINFDTYELDGDWSDWYLDIFYLDAYLGDSSVYIGFNFESDYSNTYEGAYVDEIWIDKEVNSDPAELTIVDWDTENEPWTWGDTAQLDLDVENIGGETADTYIKVIASNDTTLWDSDDYIIFDWHAVIDPGTHWTKTNYTWTLPDTPYPNMPENDTVYYYVHVGDPFDLSDYDSVSMSTPKGNLNVTVRDQNGTLAPDGTDVFLYRTYSPDVHFEQTTINGIATFTNLEIGPYEAAAVYKPSPAYSFGEFWGDQGGINVLEGTTTSDDIEIQRFMPYALGIQPADYDTGQYKYEFDLGETVEIAYQFDNPDQNDRDVKVQVQADRDKSGGADFDQTSSYVNIAGYSSYQGYMYFTPTVPGDYYLRPQGVFTYTVGDQLTDSWDWPSDVSFRVVANTPPTIDLLAPNDNYQTVDVTPAFSYTAGDSDTADNLTVQIYIAEDGDDPFNNSIPGYPKTTWTGTGGISDSWSAPSEIPPGEYSWGMTINDGTETTYSGVRDFDILAGRIDSITFSPTSSSSNPATGEVGTNFDLSVFTDLYIPSSQTVALEIVLEDESNNWADYDCMDNLASGTYQSDLSFTNSTAGYETYELIATIHSDETCSSLQSNVIDVSETENYYIDWQSTNYEISGYAPDGSTVILAQIGSTIDTTVASGGSYSFTGLNEGLYYVYDSQIGFVSSPYQAATLNSGNQQQTLNFSLTPLVSQSKSVCGWIPNFDYSNGFTSFSNNKSVFDEVSLAAYVIGANGSDIDLDPNVNVNQVTNEAHGANIASYITIGAVNLSDRVHDMLNNQSTMEAHVDNIVLMVVETQSEGVDIDYEGIDLADKDKFSDFIDLLAQELHIHGKALSVTLQPKTGPSDPVPAQAQDYYAIGGDADQVRIMAYDNNWGNQMPPHHSETDWVEDVMAYAVTQIPSPKLKVALPFYGYADSVDTGNGKTWSDVQNIIANNGVDPREGQTRDTSYPHTNFIPNFSYNDGSDHQVWYEDDVSVQKKLDIILDQNLDGVCFWRLGGEDPESYDAISKMLDGQRFSEIALTSVELLDTSDSPKTQFTAGETAKLRVHFENAAGKAPLDVEAALDLREPDNSTIGYREYELGAIQAGPATSYVDFLWNIPTDAELGMYDIASSIRGRDFFTIYDFSGPDGGNIWLDDQLEVISGGVPNILLVNDFNVPDPDNPGTTTSFENILETDGVNYITADYTDVNNGTVNLDNIDTVVATHSMFINISEFLIDEKNVLLYNYTGAPMDLPSGDLYYDYSSMEITVPTDPLPNYGPRPFPIVLHLDEQQLVENTASAVIGELDQTGIYSMMMVANDFADGEIVWGMVGIAETVSEKVFVISLPACAATEWAAGGACYLTAGSAAVKAAAMFAGQFRDTITIEKVQSDNYAMIYDLPTNNLDYAQGTINCNAYYITDYDYPLLAANAPEICAQQFRLDAQFGNFTFDNEYLYNEGNVANPVGSSGSFTERVDYRVSTNSRIEMDLVDNVFNYTSLLDTYSIPMIPSSGFQPEIVFDDSLSSSTIYSVGPSTEDFAISQGGELIKILGVDFQPPTPAQGIPGQTFDLEIQVGMEVGQDGILQALVQGGSSTYETVFTPVEGLQSTVVSLNVPIFESDPEPQSYTAYVYYRPGATSGPLNTTEISDVTTGYHTYEINWDNRPVANLDVYEVTMGETLNIGSPGVLENDTDVENDPLFVSEVNDSASNVGSTIGTGKGLLTVQSDGSFEYVHSGSDETTDSFTYYPSDGVYESEDPGVVIIQIDSPDNDSPTDIMLSNSDVDENKSVGTLVGTFTTSDPDTGDTHTYELVTGSGDTDNASFTVDADTGELKTAEVFDFETKNSYSIRVKTTDDGTNPGPLSFEKEFTISVNDVNEVLTCPVDEFKAEYFDNPTLTGSPVLTRCETEINNYWGEGSPDASVPNDNFSVRWSGNFNFDSGEYKFTVTTDDGMRLWVDDNSLIDEWYPQGGVTHEASVVLAEGEHEVKVEYYEEGWSAMAVVDWKLNNPPEITSTPVLSVVENDQYNYDVDATDLDEDTLEYNLVQAPGSMSIDSQTGVISWTPGVVDRGIHNIEVEASDGSLTDTQAFTVAVEAEPAEQTGEIVREYWLGIDGSRVSYLTDSPDYPDNPSGSEILDIFETPSNWADNYGSRLRGYVHVPITGEYTFWTASDDQSELWLSTDDTAANAVKIAYVDGWANEREWDKYPEQQSVPITLQAGEKYYIEALHKDGTSEDNMAVGWQLPDGRMERPIPGSRLTPFEAQEITCTEDQYKVEYFDNKDLAGNPVATQCETEITHDFGNDGPGFGIGDDNFSLRLVGNINFAEAGDYEFMMRSDDGMRVWVDDVQILDEWYDHGFNNEFYETVNLTQGLHEIKVEYYENGGAAVFDIDWNLVMNAPPIIEIVEPDGIDDVSNSNYTITWIDQDPDNDAVINFFYDTDNTGNDGIAIPECSNISEDDDTDSCVFDLSTVPSGSYYVYATIDDGVNPQVVQYSTGALRVIETGWYGEYFNNKTLTDPVEFSNLYDEINFNWGENAPELGVNADNFSARWMQDINFSSGNYSFLVEVDDAVRLYIDDTLFMDNWECRPPETFSENIFISEGIHSVRMEYYECNQGARAIMQLIEDTPPSVNLSNPTDTETAGTTALQLEWNGNDVDGDDLTYDVYIGRAGEEMTLYSADQVETNYTPTLKIDRTYYWKVIAKDGKGGETESETWSFYLVYDGPQYELYGEPAYDIVASSAGLFAGDYAELYVRDTDYSLNGRGVNLIVVDQTTGDILDQKSYDTFSSPTESDSLATYLNNIEIGRYVALAIKDEGTNSLTENARVAIENLGSTMIRNVGYRDAWSMIVQKGDPNNIQEAVHEDNELEGSAIVRKEGSEESPTLLPGTNTAVNLEVISQGLLFGDNVSIKVGGVERALNQTGINIVVVNGLTGEIVDTHSFNTFDNPEEADALVVYLDSIEEGRYVLVGIKDDGNRLLKGSIRLKFEELGSTQAWDIDFRDSWAMIFQKGTDKPVQEMLSKDSEASVIVLGGYRSH